MLKQTISITKHIEIVWEIKGFQAYGFGKDKQLYNLKTGRRIKQTLNCCSYGYWLGKKFLTLNKLRPLLIKPEKHHCPF